MKFSTQNLSFRMNTKIAILILILIYLFVQNFISVYVLNISVNFKPRNLILQRDHLKLKPFQLHFSHYPRKVNVISYLNPVTTSPAVKSSIITTRLKNVSLPEKHQEQSKPNHSTFSVLNGLSYHYQHMKNYTKMIGLFDNLKTHFGNNWNVSFPYDFIIKNQNICSSKIFLLNLLLSSPSDFKAREDIRSMWGSRAWKKATGYQLVHLLGRSEDERVNENVLKENGKYGDIVQIDFKDSYDNLTIKVMAGFHWTIEFCPDVEWVMKSDKDVFVNVFRLASFLKYYNKEKYHLQSKILCKPKPAYELHPLRNDTKLKKWNIDKEEYPFDAYPPHCYGPAYIMSRRLIPTFYAAADKLHPFRFEDVYYTGVIPQLIEENINIVNIGPLFSWRPKKWSRNLVEKSLMILEVEKSLGRKATLNLWNKIISYLKSKSKKSQKIKKVTPNV